MFEFKHEHQEKILDNTLRQPLLGNIENLNQGPINDVNGGCKCPRFEIKSKIGCGEICHNLLPKRQRELINQAFKQFKLT